MPSIIPLRPQVLQQSESGESSSQVDNDEAVGHFEFIAEVDATDSDQLPESPLKLHFVPETGTARPDGTLRNLIRSHARRKPRRRPRSLSQAKLQALNKLNKGSDSSAVDGARRDGRRPSRERHSEDRHISLYRGPECDAMDPFYTLPITETNQTQFLIYYYDSVFAESDCPVNPRKEWIPFAMTDPALLHVTLVFSAWSLETLQGRPPTPVVMYHKAESIRQLNKNLLIPNRDVSDSTIAVVACLTKCENLSANAPGVRIHIDGLEALVNSRGGIQALPIHGHARKLATWVDCCGAIVMDTQPRFKLPSLEDEERPEDWGLYSSLAMLYEAKIFHLTGLRDLGKETMEVYWGMRNLTGLKEVAVHLTQRVEFASWSDMVERLERRVITLLRSEVLKSRNNPNFSIFKLFGHAAIFHIYMFMRDLPRGLPFYHLVSGRLRASIEAADLKHLQKEYPEMMLWIILVGGLGSTGTPNRGWYADLLAQACMASGLRGGNAIAYALAEFLWSELYRSPVTMGFWNDVARAQGVGSGYDVKRLTDHISVATFNAAPNMLE